MGWSWGEKSQKCLFKFLRRAESLFLCINAFKRNILTKAPKARNNLSQEDNCAVLYKIATTRQAVEARRKAETFKRWKYGPFPRDLRRSQGACPQPRTSTKCSLLHWSGPLCLLGIAKEGYSCLLLILHPQPLTCMCAPSVSKSTQTPAYAGQWVTCKVSPAEQQTTGAGGTPVSPVRPRPRSCTNCFYFLIKHNCSFLKS